MLLARTDTFFLLLLIAGDGFWRSVSRGAGSGLTRPHVEDSSVGQAADLSYKAAQAAFLIRWGIVGFIVVALLLPWFWWNLVTFGTVVQSSAIAAPRLVRYSLTAPLDRGVSFATVFRERYAPILLLAGTLTFRYGGLALSAAGAALILSRLLRGRYPRLAGLHPLWLPFAGAVAPLLVHTFVRWYPRSWYYVPLAWAVALLGGAVIDRAAQDWPRRVRLALLASLALVLALQAIKSWRAGFYPWQGHMLAGARWAAESAPPGAVVASFNSGLQAYYGRRTIVNLDGVVNWEALQAMEQRALLAYARQRGATHLVDYRAYIFDSFYPFFEEGFQGELRPVLELSPDFPPYGAVEVYRIKSGE
ncbi:MAG: hypothetical protein ACE5H9_11960, partial [Anaerolineae bacterium]